MMSVALTECTSVRTGELENEDTANEYGCEGASGARGGRLYTGSDDEDSSVVEDLRAMFPLLDEEVLTTVLQAHEGRVEGAIDYLMVMNSQQAEGIEDMMPQPALQSFSEDIGGLPELIPSFVDEDEEDEDEFDPLPSYDEICPPLEPGPPPYSPPSQDHPFLAPTRSRLAANFSLPHTTSLPGADSPSLAPSRDPLQGDSPTVPPSREPPPINSPTLAFSRDPPQTDSPSGDPPQTDSPSGDPPQTDSPSRDPPQIDSPSGDPAQIGSPSRDPPQTDSPSGDPAQTDSPSGDPPQTDSPSGDPAQTDSSSRDPPQTDSPSRDPPQTDCITIPANRDPQADRPTPSRDPPQTSLIPNGDQQLQDISNSVGGGMSSTVEMNGRCQHGNQRRHNDFFLQRSGTSEQACSGDISSDEDFDHRDGWQSLAGEESPTWSDRSSRPGHRHKLRKFAKKLSLRKSSKSDYKAVQESFGAESHPLPYLPLVVDDELSDEGGR